MYPWLGWVDEAMADTNDTRPMIMCEYAYSKSNSNGNFKDFWDYVDKFALRNNTGVGLAIMGFNLLHFDAHRNVSNL